MSLPSIRKRLADAVLHLSLAWGLAVSGVVWLAVQHEVDEVMDSALKESAEILYGLLSFHASELPLTRRGALPAPPHAENLVWQIVDRSGSVALRSHHAPDAALAAAGRTGLIDAGKAWRVFGMPFDTEGRVLYVAQTGMERREARMEAAEFTALCVLLVGALCALLLRRRVGRELRPLQELSREVANFQPMEPATTLPPPQRAELRPLREAILDLGRRLAERVRHERAFAGQAAHALRTPLAGLGAQLAVAWREATPAQQPRLARAREAADRLGRVVSALLTLFRSGVEPQRQALDLQDLVDSLPVEGLHIEVQRNGPLEADPDLLAAALLNLFDNALRYGARTVTLALEPGPEGVVALQLQDDGPGVEPARHAQLQAALASGDFDAVGPGLGLRLAERVARAHGGSLVLRNVARGFALSLTIGPRPA